jgi:hypothetical protein
MFMLMLMCMTICTYVVLLYLWLCPHPMKLYSAWIYGKWINETKWRQADSFMFMKVCVCSPQMYTLQVWGRRIGGRGGRWNFRPVTDNKEEDTTQAYEVGEHFVEHSLRTGWQTIRKHWEGIENIGENQNKLKKETGVLGKFLDRDIAPVNNMLLVLQFLITKEGLVFDCFPY